MSHLVSIAPMMDCTDRHDRFFLRLISKDVQLYTEMITALALHHGDVSHLLRYHPAEHPIALQLGGSDPSLLAEGAKLGEEFGYDEINLNVGCPSDRVQSGQFGACLMLKPQLVAECVAAMQMQVNIPVTVKCRIGVDHQDSYESLYHFIKQVSDAGCSIFIIHARKAWLSGLSPKENREVPPLQYEIVWQIKKDFPNLKIIINGGIQTIVDVDQHLSHVDGVMIGRQAYSNPYFLAEIQRKYFSDKKVLSRQEVIEKLIPYVHEQMQNKVKLTAISRHVLGMFFGEQGAAAWRRYISEHAHKPGATVQILEKALQLVTKEESV